MKFVHKKSGRIVDYPEHFANSRIGKNLTPYVEEVEEEKVVLEYSPNSQTRVGKKVKETPTEIVSVDDEKVTD